MVSVGLHAQYTYAYSFYYGKNKIQKTDYKWQYIETEHFNIYYYTANKSLLKKLAQASEEGYETVSNYLNVQVKKKIPLIFYSTHMEFELTNIASYVPQGALAFAESIGNRVVIQGDETFDELKRTITHELGHIFEYEIFGRRIRFSAPPLWTMEGFSDFIADVWDDFNLMIVRDAVLAEQIPQLAKDGNLRGGSQTGRTAYDFGHMIYDFLAEKYGRRGVKKFLFSLRGGRRIFGGDYNIMRGFDITTKQFNHQFGKWSREKFKNYLTKENPEDYSYLVGPDFPFVYAFSHDVSPSGEMAAVLTVDYKNRSLEIILLSVKDGKVIKTITPGLTSIYDSINIKFNPTDGRSFAWNKDSDVIAFFARKAWDNYLVLVNIVDKQIVKRIKLKNVQDPASPNFLPGNDNIIYFTARDETRSNLYAIDLNTKKVKQISDGSMYVRSFDISDDGKKVVLSAKAGDYMKLYLGPIENPMLAKQLTSGDYNDIAPNFTKDGKNIYYTSTELGAYNINSIDLETQTMYRYSDVRTGNFFPVELPKEKDKVLISSFYKGIFNLYKLEIDKPQETRKLQFEDYSKVAAAKVEEIPEGKEIEFKDMGKYKPLKKFFVKGTPGVGIGYGTDGGFLGYSQLTLSDLMGDHNFNLVLYSYYGYRSYQMAYLNQKGRLQFYGRLFNYTHVYYPYYTYTYSRTLTNIYGGEFGFWYPFSREYRIEATASIMNRNENYDNLVYGFDLPYGQFFDGIATPIRFSLVGETTRFNYFGPLTGHTFNLTFQKYFKIGDNFMDCYTIYADFRKYLRLDNLTLLALRFQGFTSGGDHPMLFYSGGNNSVRSSDYMRLVGNNYFNFTAEFRFNLVQAALTPIGVVGPVRGVFFFDLAGSWYKGQDFRFLMEGEGLRLQDAVSSYGFGVEFFLFGYPMHIEWIWKNDFATKLFTEKSYYGANFWIGFDF